MTDRMMPAEVKRLINYRLLRLPVRSQGYVSVTPQDENGRKCAAWRAHHYEVFAYPISLSAPLEPIAEALRDLPGATDVTIRTAADMGAGHNPIRPGVYARLPVARQP